MRPLKNAFIVGCPRSGTSILGELVACHNNIQYYFETKNVWQKESVHPVRIKIGNNLPSHRMTAKDYKVEDARRIRHFFKSNGNIYNPPLTQPLRFLKWLIFNYRLKQVVVEKNPRNALRISYIHSVFPDAKFIHIIRDGRDVTCSLLAGIGGKEWNHARPSSWKELAKLAPIKRCALTWQEIVLTADRDLNNLPSTSKHLLRYEDFVNNTMVETNRLFEFLELRITKNVGKFIDKIQNKTEQSYHANNQIHWYRANHSTRIGRWHENLTSEQQKEVLELIGSTLSYFDYI
jgi:hypothetical protein